MESTTLIPIAEYMETSYSPDREYVDGVVVERNVGERPHSLVQGNIHATLRHDYPRFYVWIEQRVCTIRGLRTRIPDVCLTLVDPLTDVFETPPFIYIEVLSRRDEAGDLFDKLEEYAAFGVPNIWVIDPRKRRAFIRSGSSLDEVHGGVLVTSNPEIRLPLEEAFRGL